jgi:hypothetical protein
MLAEWPNQPGAVNGGVAFLFHLGHSQSAVTDPERSAKSCSILVIPLPTIPLPHVRNLWQRNRWQKNFRIPGLGFLAP